MASVFRKSAAALLAALLIASALSGCFKVQKIDSPASPAPTETLSAGQEPEPQGPSALPGNQEQKPDAPAPDSTPIAIDYTLLESALAIGLTGNGTDYLYDANGLWHVVGIYAALLARVGDRPMGAWLSDRECGTLAAVLLPNDNPPGIPDAWFSDGGLVHEEMNGVPGISFPSYEEYLGSMLGIWRELRRPEDGEDASYAVEVIDHLDDGVWHTFVYIAFEEDPNDGLTKLVYLFISDSLLEASSFPFTLDDVREQNRISNLLRSYDSVTFRSYDPYGTDDRSFWLRDGDQVFYEVTDLTVDDAEGEPISFHSESGAYRDLEFNTYLMAEPMIYVWVTADERDPAEARMYYDTLISSYVPEIPTSDPVLVSEDDETCTFTVEEAYETADGVPGTLVNTVTVVKETLAILSYSWTYEEGSGGFTVSYNGEKLGEAVMSAWDKTRTLTLDIMTGEGNARTETVAVPESWLVQLLPDDGVTVYFDETCRELTYSMLDAGGDVTLWARDGANTPAADSQDGADLPADLPGFALEDVIDANYLTVLLDRFGQVGLRQTYDYGSSSVYYFPFRDTVAYCGEDSYTFDSETTESRYGSDGDIYYEIDGDGTVRGFAYPDLTLGEDYIAYHTDPEGRYIPDNAYLCSSLFDCTVTDLEERDDTYILRAEYVWSEDEPPTVLTFTLEKGTLAILNYTVEGADYSLTTEYGENIAPYADALREAFSDTRTVTYHVHMDGEQYDRSFEVPKSWEFTLHVKEEMRFFKDKGLTDPTENLIPADRWNHEIWVTDARG